MKLTIYFDDGDIKRGIDVFCVEYHTCVLHVYYTVAQYMDQLPDDFDNVKAFTMFDDRRTNIWATPIVDAKFSECEELKNEA